MAEQKVKFKGNKNQIFVIGKTAFSAGVWHIVTHEQIQRIVKFGLVDIFEFNPPLADVTRFEEEKPAEEEKPKRRRRKKKEKVEEEADE